MVAPGTPRRRKSLIFHKNTAFLPKKSHLQRRETHLQRQEMALQRQEMALQRQEMAPQRQEIAPPGGGRARLRHRGTALPPARRRGAKEAKVSPLARSQQLACHLRKPINNARYRS